MKTPQTLALSSFALLLSAGLAEGQVCSVRFEPAVSSPTNGAFVDSVHDMTGDGRADVVARDLFGFSVRILAGSTNGSLAPVSSISPVGPLGTLVANFDGNSIPDLAVLDETGFHSVYLGAGGGAFGAPIYPPAPAISFFGFGAGDFNQDLHQDLAVIWGTGPLTARLILGDGAGGFSNGGDSPLDSVYISMGFATGEFTGDQATDIVGIQWANGTIMVLPNLGGGGFGPAISSMLGFEALLSPPIDLDADGDLDLVAVDRNDQVIRILLNTGGAFAVAAQLAAPGVSSACAVADFDGDGRSDLVYNELAGRLRILRGTGPISYEPLTDWASTAGNGSLWAGDVDGNGWVDVVRQDYNLPDSVEVYLNRGCSVIEVPTLDRTGLAALVGLLAVAAFLLLRRSPHTL